MMHDLLLPIFIINMVLVLVDASLGFHLAPVLFRASAGNPETSEAGIRSLRLLLTGVVALYMFFNCLAYFRNNAPLLLVVTVLILFDLGGQLYIRYRSRSHQGEDQE